MMSSILKWLVEGNGIVSKMY